MRADAAQAGQVAAAQVDVAQLHRGVSLLLRPRTVVPAQRDAWTTDSMAALTFSPPTGSRSNRPVTRPSGWVARVNDRPIVGSGSGPSWSRRSR